MTRLLLADDSADSRKLLVEQLKGSGYELEVARDGIEALAKARERLPDLIISDLLMPRMDGFMLLRECRADPILANVPFVVVTATFTETDDEALVRGLGADDFLIKPVAPEDLIARIEAVLHRDTGDTQRLLSVNAEDGGALQTYNERLGQKLQTKIRELERTRRVLRSSDDLYSSLFRNNHSPMLLVNPEDGSIVDVNQAAVSFYGWRREEILALTVDDINVLPADVIAAEMTKASQERRSYFVFQHRCADGSVKDVEVYSGPVTVRGRHLLYSIVHDISERREAETRLKRAENLLRIASSLARVGGWEVDMHSERIAFSDESCRILGLSPGSTISLVESSEFYAPEYRGRIAKIFYACANDGVPYDDEVRVLRSDGASVWVRTVGEPVRDDSGAIIGVHGALQDIDEQMRAREELRQLWLAVEQSPESILVTDLTPKILYVNDACCRISGYSRSEMLGHNPSLLRSGKTPRETIAALWQSLRSGRPWSGIMHNRRKDGTEYVESATISPVRQEDGRITHYLAVKEDITEQRKTENELKRYRDHLEDLVEQRTGELAEARRQAELANQAKSVFLANMSHEIRTPLNGVLGTLEVLEAKPLADDQRELVATIKESGRSLIRIIEDILDFSRIEAGRLTLERAEFSLEEAVEGLCESLVQMAHERGVDLHVYVAPELPRRLFADEVRLRQILYNLVGNGIKFSGGRSELRGRVRLSAERSPEYDEHIRFTIADNGIGISEEGQKRLFQPFTQAEGSTTRRFGGSGLGLVICQRLVELKRGRIALDSTPGTGTTFHVDLPLRPANQQPVTNHAELNGCQCVIVEDEAIDARAVEAYLRDSGAKVACVPPGAENGGEAGRTTEERIVIQAAETDGDGGLREVGTRGRIGPHIYLLRGRGQGLRRLEGGDLTLGASAMRRRALIDAVGIVSGRADQVASARAYDVSAEATRQPLSVEEARAKGNLILVAEDDEISRKVIAHQLRLLGYTAEIARDGREALRMWRNGSYALLLTDLHMPELDGYELTSAIRHDESMQAGEGKRMPIIALTANALRGEAARAERRGMDGYITKPLQLERLRQALAIWMKPAEGGGETGAGNQDQGSKFPVFDPSILDDIVGTDTAVKKEFLGDYLKSAEGLLADFRRACDASDARQAGAIAHKLKSSSRAVGALSLGALCERLEKLGREGNVERCCRRADELTNTFELAQRAIAEYLRG